MYKELKTPLKTLDFFEKECYYLPLSKEQNKK